MQSYEDFERQELQELMIQNKPEPLIDKSYRLHQEQRKANKKVNMSFNMLTFAIKQQVSVDKQGEKHGNVD